jgi:hypothetical protein
VKGRKNDSVEMIKIFKWLLIIFEIKVLLWISLTGASLTYFQEVSNRCSQ